MVDVEGEEQAQVEEGQITLRAIKQLIAQEFGEIEGQLQQLRKIFLRLWNQQNIKLRISH